MANQLIIRNTNSLFLPVQSLSWQYAHGGTEGISVMGWSYHCCVEACFLFDQGLYIDSSERCRTEVWWGIKTVCNWQHRSFTLLSVCVYYQSISFCVSEEWDERSDPPPHRASSYKKRRELCNVTEHITLTIFRALLLQYCNNIMSFEPDLWLPVHGTICFRNGGKPLNN